jgi:hypothetical protein
MNEEQIKKILEVIKEEEKDFDFNDYVGNYIDKDRLKEIEELDEIKEYLEELDEDGEITRAEVIYYSNAIEYLKENDPSLNESLELANDMGFSLDKINSEVLASLLKTENNYNEYREFVNSVYDILEDSELFKEV